MVFKKKIFTLLIFTGLVAGGVAAVQHPKGQHKNLKVLPEDISVEKLDSFMKSYNVALGVDCKFCHVNVANFPDSLDYASDDNIEKENAREMMRMTISINKTYFNYKNEVRAEYLNIVQCMSCHRGDPYPTDPLPIPVIKNNSLR